MQEYVKKYWWLFTPLVVVVCSVFAAKTANNVIEGKFLADSAKPAKRHRARARRTPSKTLATARSKAGEPIAKRNIFCSECKPPEPEVPVGGGPAPAPGDEIPKTALPLRLVATNVSSKKKWSFATIRNTDSESQGAYWLEDPIPGAGPVRRIGGKFVDFFNEENKRVERVTLLDKTHPAARKKVASRPTRRGRRGALSAELDAGIKKIDATTYEIERALVNKLLANPMSVSRGARIVPSIKNGKANGFKLYAIRPSSIYAKLGMMNGDTIHGVNGFNLTSASKALEVYAKVRTASNLSVTVTRRGKPVNLKYSIR